MKAIHKQGTASPKVPFDKAKEFLSFLDLAFKLGAENIFESACQAVHVPLQERRKYANFCAIYFLERWSEEKYDAL